MLTIFKIRMFNFYSFISIFDLRQVHRFIVFAQKIKDKLRTIEARFPKYLRTIEANFFLVVLINQNKCSNTDLGIFS